MFRDVQGCFEHETRQRAPSRTKWELCGSLPSRRIVWVAREWRMDLSPCKRVQRCNCFCACACEKCKAIAALVPKGTREAIDWISPRLRELWDVVEHWERRRVRQAVTAA